MVALARLREDVDARITPPPGLTQLSEPERQELIGLLLDDVHEVMPLLDTDSRLLTSKSSTRPWQSLIRFDYESIKAPDANTTTTTTPVNATNVSLTDIWDKFFSASKSHIWYLGPIGILLLISPLLCCMVRGSIAQRQQETAFEQPGHDEMHEAWVRPQHK